MTKPTSIRVCDDNGARAENWATDIERALTDVAELDVKALRVEQFAEAFDDLKLRQREARNGSEAQTGPALSFLEEAEIVVSDFDLTPAQGVTDLGPDTLKTLSGSFGDVFAYLLRNFADAPFVVLANQAFFQSTFDLTHMRFATSNADLNIAGDDLRRPALWTGTSNGTTYRPWHWPRLLDVGPRRRTLAEGLDLDAPVLATLGLADADTKAQFSPEQLEFLGERPDELRFRDVCATIGRFGRSTEHERIPPRFLPQATVSIICHWLERIVLPGQNVIIDAPHLAQRRPAVMGSRDLSDWAGLSDLSRSTEVRGLMEEGLIAAAELPALAAWMSRPVWAWHRVPRATRVSSVDEPRVFCEDVSGFHPLHEAWEYESSVPGPFTQRFVLNDVGEHDAFPIEYWPQNRLFAEDA